MQVVETTLPDVLILEPRVFEDDRGWFYESYNVSVVDPLLGVEGFVQDNQSRSARGVLRGLHYQLPPSAQGKLVRCVRGSVFDVAVDIRQSSETFGQWFGVDLSEDNKKQLWVPVGFAHGFLALEAETEVFYKTTAFYDSSSERSIRWDDPTIHIEWPDLGSTPTLTDKDIDAPLLEQAETFD
jgi:dTDP-4-dehydrorhamnose 3,5-epimerase